MSEKYRVHGIYVAIEATMGRGGGGITFFPLTVLKRHVRQRLIKHSHT